MTFCEQLDSIRNRLVAEILDSTSANLINQFGCFFGIGYFNVVKLHQRRGTDDIKAVIGYVRDKGGGIPLSRGEVAMLFLDGYAGDGPNLLDNRSQGYGHDHDCDGLTDEDVLEDKDTAFVWTKWEPMELWLDS